jgi:hypothetical protein
MFLAHRNAEKAARSSFFCIQIQLYKAVKSNQEVPTHHSIGRQKEVYLFNDIDDRRIKICLLINLKLIIFNSNLVISSSFILFQVQIHVSSSSSSGVSSSSVSSLNSGSSSSSSSNLSSSSSSISSPKFIIINAVVLIGELKYFSSGFISHQFFELQREILSPRRGPGEPPEKNLDTPSGQDYTFASDLNQVSKWTEVADWNSAMIQVPKIITSSFKFSEPQRWIGPLEKNTSSSKFRNGNFIFIIGERKKVCFIRNRYELNEIMKCYRKCLVLQNGKITSSSKVIPEIPIHIVVKGEGGSENREKLEKFALWYIGVWKNYAILNNVKEDVLIPFNDEQLLCILNLTRRHGIFYPLWLADTLKSLKRKEYNDSMLAPKRLSDNEVKEEFSVCFNYWKYSIRNTCFESLKEPTNAFELREVIEIYQKSGSFKFPRWLKRKYTLMWNYMTPKCINLIELVENMKLDEEFLQCKRE